MAVEQHAEDILLEVPSVDRAPEVVRDRPYRAVKLLSFLLFHLLTLSFVSNADFLMRRIPPAFVLTLPFMCILYQILLLYSFIRK